MKESKSLPKFNTLDELVEFFETHDLGDYLDHVSETDFDIELEQTTHFFALDADLADKLTEIAKARRIPSEALVNAWLRERILERV